jgi:FtsZ-binding cell division protein ZapB
MTTASNTASASTTLTITRALAEIKVLGDRIEKATDRLKVLRVGLRNPQSAAVREEQEAFCAQAQAGFQSVIGLIQRRQALKSAVLRSNAVTQVTIGGETMTVAEAIERKNSIKFEQSLLQELQSDFRCENRNLETARQSFRERLDRFIEGQEKILKEPALLAQATSTFTGLHEPVLLNPIGVEEKIEILSEEVENFLLEVDFALSESNARTTVTV